MIPKHLNPPPKPSDLLASTTRENHGLPNTARHDEKLNFSDAISEATNPAIVLGFVKGKMRRISNRMIQLSNSDVR
jgi:hypothetical protein